MSGKNFVKVSHYRRAFPKRKFADGGVSANRKTPGFADGGGLKMGLDQRGNNIHSNDGGLTWVDDRGQASTGPQFNVTNIGPIGKAEPDLDQASRVKQYGSDPTGAMAAGVRTAETAAPAPSVLSSPEPSPAAKPDRFAGAIEVKVPEPWKTAPPAATPIVETPPADYTPPAASSVALENARTNAPESSKSIDWKKIVAESLAGDDSKKTAATPASPLASLVNLAGTALGTYLRKRRGLGATEGNAKGGKIVSPSSLDQNARNTRPVRPPAGPPAGMMPPTAPVGPPSPPPGPPPGPPMGAAPPMPPPAPPADPRLVAALGQRANVPGYKKGGAVAVEPEAPRNKTKPARQWGDVGKPAEDLPPAAAMKKGGAVHRRPTSKKKLSKGEKLPVPMVTDEDMGTAPVPPAAAVAAAPPVPPPAPAGPPPPMMAKGGKMAEGGACEAKMAEGGVAKLRRGYPKTNGTAKVKKMAKGGSVRGCGAAKRGTGFSGVY